MVASTALCLDGSSARSRVARVARGFTLLEMMLVVVIMGILATVAVVSFGGATNKAKRGTTIARMQQIKTALEQYNGENSTYPPDLRILTTGASKLLEQKALNDAWDRPLVYQFPGSSGDPERPYDLYSLGGKPVMDPQLIIDVWTMENKK